MVERILKYSRKFVCLHYFKAKTKEKKDIISQAARFPGRLGKNGCAINLKNMVKIGFNIVRISETGKYRVISFSKMYQSILQEHFTDAYTIKVLAQ